MSATAAVNGTAVLRDGVVVATLNRGGIYETSITAATGSVFETSAPTLVTQYGKSVTAAGNNGNLNLDPFMMIVPPDVSFANAYTFQVPPGYSDWVNIVARTADIGGSSCSMEPS